MNNVRKKHVHITEKTYSEKIYATQDETESDHGDNVDNAMDDSDEEFIATDDILYHLVNNANVGTCGKCARFSHNH